MCSCNFAWNAGPGHRETRADRFAVSHRCLRREFLECHVHPTHSLSAFFLLKLLRAFADLVQVHSIQRRRSLRVVTNMPIDASALAAAPATAHPSTANVVNMEFQSPPIRSAMSYAATESAKLDRIRMPVLFRSVFSTGPRASASTHTPINGRCLFGCSP
jgi:hypothetical protein